MTCCCPLQELPPDRSEAGELEIRCYAMRAPSTRQPADRDQIRATSSPKPSSSTSAIFQPLRFRNLEVKNRVFRSSISGRFDNYDGSGTDVRLRWDLKFARGGVGAIISSNTPVHPRGLIVPNYAHLDADDKIPFWRELESSRASTAANTWRRSPTPAASATSPASRTRRVSARRTSRSRSTACRASGRRSRSCGRSSSASRRLRGAPARPSSMGSRSTGATAT